MDKKKEVFPQKKSWKSSEKVYSWTPGGGGSGNAVLPIRGPKGLLHSGHFESSLSMRRSKSASQTK